MATLLGARLVAAGADASKLSIFTFGAPTVGNTAFAEEYGCLLDVSRYTMSGDLVKNALQMLKSGYVQFGTEYNGRKMKIPTGLITLWQAIWMQPFEAIMMNL